MSGQRLRTSARTRSMRGGVAQPIVSASEKHLISAPASSAIASPSSRVRITWAGADVALVVAAERRHDADPR